MTLLVAASNTSGGATMFKARARKSLIYVFDVRDVAEASAKSTEFYALEGHFFACVSVCELSL